MNRGVRGEGGGGRTKGSDMSTTRPNTGYQLRSAGFRSIFLQAGQLHKHLPSRWPNRTE